MLKKIRILFFMFLVVMSCTTSCNNGLGDSESDDYSEVLVEHMMTKGTGSGHVYRVGLKGENATITALYSDSYQDAPLVPGYFDSDGNFIEDSEWGLRAVEGDYKLFLVYPPREDSQVEYNDDDYIGKRGYKVTRIPSVTGITGGNEDFANSTGKWSTKSVTSDDDFAFSEVVDVTLDGVYLKRRNESSTSYIFDASTMMLKKKRSKVKVTFKCGNDIPGVTLESISLNNIINEGYYNPAEQVLYYDRNLESIRIYENGDGLFVSKNSQADIGDAEHYILSMDYSERDYDGTAKWPQPEISVYFKGAEETLTTPLAINLLPLHVYSIDITVNSTQVSIDVSTAPWDEVHSGGTIEDQEDWNIVINTPGWIEKGGIEDGIGQN